MLCCLCCSVSKTNAVGLLRTFIKQLYDMRMSSRTGDSSHLLPELYIDNFDNEQIFQQLEMFNNDTVEDHRRAIMALQTRTCSKKVKTSSLSSPLSKNTTDESGSAKKQVTFESDNLPNLDAYADDSIEEEDGEPDSEADSEDESALQKLLDSMNTRKTDVQSSNVDSDIDDDDGGDDSSESDDEDSEAKLNSDSSDDDSDTYNDRTASSRQCRTMPKQKVKQVSAVDDQFFKLAEMEAFLDEQDLKEQRQHSSNADDTEDDDYDLSADEKVMQFFVEI